MSEQKTMVRPRWTIILREEDAEKWQDIDFQMVHKVENAFSPEYTMCLIQSHTLDCEYSAYEVMEITGALAVHEEYSMAVVTSPDGVEEMGWFMYNWTGGGSYMLGDMLTDIERLQILMDSLYQDHQDIINIADIKISTAKDGPLVPLGNRIDELFTKDVYSLQYKDNDPYIVWWGGLIDKKGYFLAVVDEEGEDEEDNKVIPFSAGYRRYDTYWDDYYDY